MSSSQTTNAQDFMHAGAIHDDETEARPHTMDELASTSQPNRKEAHNARGPAEHPKEHGEGKIGLDTDIRRQRSDKNSTFQITGKFCKFAKNENDITGDHEDGWSMIMNLSDSEE